MNGKNKRSKQHEKNILYFLILLCLLFSGCGKEENLIEESAAIEDASIPKGNVDEQLGWKYKDANRIHSAIMKEVNAGDIILCHDLHGTTVDAMERVIPDLIEQGYQLVTVSELLAHSSKEITAGGVYNNQ